MARRASKKINMGMLVGIIVGLVACLVVIIAISGDGVGRGGSTLAQFPIDDFMSRGSSMRDNVYEVTGRVEDRIPRGTVELVVLVVKKSDSQEERLPIIVPQDARSINIEREQGYKFRVRVKDQGDAKGLLYAESVSLTR